MHLDYHRPVRARFIVLFASAAACGLFPDVSDLAGDGGLDAFAQEDVSVDAPTTDARADVVADVTSDGGDAAAGGWCATHTGHAFCEDFDEPGFETRWTGVVKSPSSSTVVESDAAAISLPNEMLSSATFPSGNSASHAYAFEHFPTANSLKVQAEILVDPVALPQIDPVTIVLNPPPPGYSYYDVHVDTGDGHLGNNYTPEGGANVNTDTTFANALSAWHNLELDIDLTKSSVKVFVDGALATSWTIASTSPTGFDLQLGVTAGASALDASTTGVVHVDNVLVDTQ